MATTGVELAKEVSGPLASVIAFGGFTAWWLLSSNKEEPNDIAQHVTKHVLSGLTIIDDFQTQICNMITGNGDRGKSAHVLSEHDDQDESGSSSLQTRQEIQSESTGTSAGPGDITASQINISEDVLTEPESRSNQNSPRDESSDKFEYKAEIPATFDMEQLVPAIMQGNGCYVSAALEALPSSSPDDYGCDEYGNTLLILAVQVAHFFLVASFSNYWETRQRRADRRPWCATSSAGAPT